MCIYFFSDTRTYTSRYVFSHFIYEILGSENGVIKPRNDKKYQSIETDNLKNKYFVFCSMFKCNLLLFVIEILALLKNVSL